MGSRSPLMRKRLEVPAGVEIGLDWRAAHNGQAVACALPEVAERLGVPWFQVQQAAQLVPPMERYDGSEVYSVAQIARALGLPGYAARRGNPYARQARPPKQPLVVRPPAGKRARWGRRSRRQTRRRLSHERRRRAS